MNYIAVDLATIDPTSDESERSTTATVQTLLAKYDEIHSAGPPAGPTIQTEEDQFPVMSMSDVRDYSPGPFRQFSILFRYARVVLV